MAWSSPEILKLAESFLPAADEVGKLERGRGGVSKFYRKIARRHTERLRTTQGTYIVTPSGRLIDYSHTLDAEQMAEFLESGLKKWQALSKSDRLGKSGSSATASSNYPEDGLVLNVALRKLYENKPQGRQARGVVE